MKLIRGHKSWNFDEIVQILLRSGTYTCPSLPHYRYDRVKKICGELSRLGLIALKSNDDVSKNYVVTDRFKRWKDEYESGATTLMPRKWCVKGK